MLMCDENTQINRQVARLGFGAIQHFRTSRGAARYSLAAAANESKCRVNDFVLFENKTRYALGKMSRTVTFVKKLKITSNR
jgi:hypothetical protein